MDCGPPGSSVHGIFQAGMLEWVAISSPRGSSQTRDQTTSPTLADRCFTSKPPGLKKRGKCLPPKFCSESKYLEGKCLLETLIVIA